MNIFFHCGQHCICILFWLIDYVWVSRRHQTPLYWRKTSTSEVSRTRSNISGAEVTYDTQRWNVYYYMVSRSNQVCSRCWREVQLSRTEAFRPVWKNVHDVEKELTGISYLVCSPSLTHAHPRQDWLLLSFPARWPSPVTQASYLQPLQPICPHSALTVNQLQAASSQTNPSDGLKRQIT